MLVLGIILARAGSKGLPDKCVRELLGRPVIDYTFAHAAASRRLGAVVLTTDSEAAKALARAARVEVIDRPAELAGDCATVDAAARHAVEIWEHRHGKRVDGVVLLYGNIPVRADGLIDRAVDHLARSGADSVRSVAPVSKQHPDWIHRLDGDRMEQFRRNSIYRRQDLEPLYYHDGAVIAVTRAALFGALDTPEDHQSFLGSDRRALVQRADEAVDIDELMDLHVAEAVLRSGSIRRPQGATLHWRGTDRRPQGATLQPRTTRRPQGATLQRAEGRVLVIAEAGVNHNGSVDRALQLVDIAAAAGADVVKFQMFGAAELASAAARTAPYQSRQAASQRDMLAQLELSDDEFDAIARHCFARGIAFLATPFGVKEVARIVALGAGAIKIASPDLHYRELLSAAAETGLPLIVSTGAATQGELGEAVAYLTELGALPRTTLLHCVSAYPAPLEALNLGVMQTLRECFGVAVGLSDHTESLDTGGWAAAAGAAIVEKHFTFDRRAPGPDHVMSLDPGMLRTYVANIRGVSAAMGHGQLGMNPIESEVRRAARRSIVAAETIARGSVITAGALTLKRPGTGIAPGDWEAVVGRRTRVEIAADTVIAWEMLDEAERVESDE